MDTSLVSCPTMVQEVSSHTASPSVLYHRQPFADSYFLTSRVPGFLLDSSPIGLQPVDALRITGFFCYMPVTCDCNKSI